MGWEFDDIIDDYSDMVGSGFIDTEYNTTTEDTLQRPDDPEELNFEDD